ncbi:MAG TPA: glycosyltransferase family 2 protein [Terriglobales bacterium]|nr:glycosyltransferase family 2 protein [Terriglobales bacterium]
MKYALITPAKNEAAYIEKTILSVMSQSVRPCRWVIVDDASSDDTAAVVARYAQQNSWITLARVGNKAVRNFGRKVDAFNCGINCLEGADYDLIGNLDADITLGPDYYQKVLAEFERDPQLGISGGVVYIPVGDRHVNYDATWDSVAGAVQLFRKECFQQIGGYLRIPTGGIDAAAEIMARSYGWKVRKVANNPAHEQRPTGFAHGRPWKAAYKEGVHYHTLGYHSLFYFFRCLKRLGNSPYVIGSILGILGFWYAKLRRAPVCLPPDVVGYLHSEQLQKLRDQLLRKNKVSPAY